MCGTLRRRLKNAATATISTGVCGTLHKFDFNIINLPQKINRAEKSWLKKKSLCFENENRLPKDWTESWLIDSRFTSDMTRYQKQLSGDLLSSRVGLFFSAEQRANIIKPENMLDLYHLDLTWQICKSLLFDNHITIWVNIWLLPTS